LRDMKREMRGMSSSRRLPRMRKWHHSCEDHFTNQHEFGRLISSSGLSLAEVGQRMQGEETTFPHMFLSREAEKVIRSFNCDAVYSQPVRIAQPVPPPGVGVVAGVGRGRETGARGGGV